MLFFVGNATTKILKVQILLSRNIVVVAQAAGKYLPTSSSLNFSQAKAVEDSLEDRKLLRLRSLDSSCPLFLSDKIIYLGTMNSNAPNAMIAKLK